MHLPVYSLSSLAPLYSPLWQRWLRYSVRLYLALGEPGTNTRLAEIHLRLAERRLLNELRQHRQPSPEEIIRTRAILEREQATLLGNEVEVVTLLEEFPAEEAVQHLPVE